jgi:hypothetical protein
MAQERPWTVGERVRDEGGHVATVRYIGSVASAKDRSALYIGVEWDDPTRGKVRTTELFLFHFTHKYLNQIPRPHPSPPPPPPSEKQTA